MKQLFGSLVLLFFLFQQSAAQEARLLERLDSLYLAGEYTEGEQLCQSTLDHLLPADTSLGILLLDKGNFSQELGKFADAEESYLTAAKVFTSTHDHLYFGSVLSKLSVLYSEQGRFADAKNAAEKQFGIYATTYGKDHYYTANASIVLALQLMNSGNPDSSFRLISEYRPIILRSFGEKSKEASRLHEIEGRIAFAKKDYKRAEEYFILARATAANSPGDRHPLTARIALALARTRLILGNTDSAFTNINDALTVAFRASGPSHPFTAECYMTKGSIEEAMNRISAAFESYTKALGVYKEATKENFRYTSERERLAFIRNVNEQLSRLASTALRTSAIYPKGIGVFYDGLLFQKGIVLTSLQAMRRTALQSGDSTLGKLFDSLASIRTRRSRLLNGSARIKKPFNDEDSLRDIANNLEKELARQSQAFADLQTLDTRSWHHIVKATGEGNISIEISRFNYYDGERKTDTSYYAALMVRQSDSTHPRLAVIGTGENIEDPSVMRQYFRSLEKHAKKKNSNSALITKLLWSPIEPFLENIKHVVISPDGIYDQLSFAALSDADNKPLLQHFRISTTASTADIGQITAHDSNQSISIFADPDFGAGELEALPGLQKEAKAIEHSFTDAKWKVSTYVKKNASEKNLKKIHHPTILHIATHGRFNADKYKLLDSNTLSSYSLEHSFISSALYLSGANTTLSKGSADPADDGVVTALEAMDLDLEGTDLVTLSMCESGKGVIQPGEGAFGLARAIRIAGAKNVLISLWKVSDEETKELMTAFYKNLLMNQSKSEALANAQLEEREIIKKRYGDDIPYFWAGFVLIGL